ncbi:MAG: large repetitive protein [Thermoanaerobaculia bacterium]|jgi:hypothetical protein|nr:large repetitive protein [Thermoanaerobaculia bacterium]
MRRLLLAALLLLIAAPYARAANAVIDSVSPAVLTSSPSPQTVTITGHDFSPGATVTLINKTPATLFFGYGQRVENFTGTPIHHDVTVVSPTKITMTVQYQPTATLNLIVSVSNPAPDAAPAQAPLTITAALSDATPILFTIVYNADNDSYTTTVQAHVTPHSTGYVIFAGPAPPGVVLTGVNFAPDDDADGTVTFRSFDFAPGTAVFFVIDSTGVRHSATAPWSTPLAESTLQHVSVELGPDGSVSRLAEEGTRVPLVLWVRPGVGAWWVEAPDGGNADADVPGFMNGHVTILPSSFRVLGTSPPPPASFQPSDSLVLLDVFDLGWWTSVLPTPLQGTPGNGTIYPARLGSREGTPSIVYLERRGGTEGEVSVDYRTSNDTAVGGVNYVISSGTVTFGRGEFLKAISIPTIDDGVYSPNLSFNVEFVPHGTTVSRSNTLPVTITNIDPQPALSVNDISAEEQSETAIFLVTMSRAATAPVALRYATFDGTATAPLDYAATSGTLTFAPGEISKTVTVPVVRDKIADPDETFTLRLSDAPGATILKSTGTATILESDRLPQPVVIIDDIAVAEGNSGTTDAIFNVRLSFASALPVVVAWKTENGSARDDSDYSAGIGTLTFAPGETTLPVTVKITGDTTPEPNENFRLVVVGTSNAIAGSGASCTIINDDGQAPPPRRRAAH